MCQLGPFLPPTHGVWGKVMFSVCLFTGRGSLTMDLWTGQGASPTHWTWHWTSVPPPKTWDWTGGGLLDLAPDRGVPPPDLALDLAPDRGYPWPGTGHGNPLPIRPGTRQGTPPAYLAPDRGTSIRTIWMVQHGQYTYGSDAGGLSFSTHIKLTLCMLIMTIVMQYIFPASSTSHSHS